MTHTHTNGRLRTEPLPIVAHESAKVEPPFWFQAMYLSLAVFAGPTLFAAVVGLVYLMAIIVGQVFHLVRINSGM